MIYEWIVLQSSSPTQFKRRKWDSVLEKNEIHMEWNLDTKSDFQGSVVEDQQRINSTSIVGWLINWRRSNIFVYSNYVYVSKSRIHIIVTNVKIPYIVRNQGVDACKYWSIQLNQLFFLPLPCCMLRRISRIFHQDICLASLNKLNRIIWNSGFFSIKSRKKTREIFLLI